MANAFQQVQTYNKSNLALLQNMNCAVSTFNTRFRNFNEQYPANRGDTVTFDKPPRMITANSLVASFQDTEQRVQVLSVDKAENVSYAFTDQEYIFNAEDYMQRYGKSAIAELSAKIEKDVFEVNINNTYRFFGDGVTALDSYNRLSEALALFRNYGTAYGRVQGYLSDISVANIVANGLNQFTLDRNNENAQSWQVGEFNNCDWCQSNLLPIHTAGTVGQDASTLTVVSVTKDANNAIDTITFSGAANLDVDAIKKNDKFQINDGVVGVDNVRYLTWTGHFRSDNPVQFRAEADAESDGGGNVTVTIFPKLQVAAGREQNLTTDIVASMEASVLPSHRMGLLLSGNAAYIAMPELPEQSPFATSVVTDDLTGVSIRQYYGTLFGQAQSAMIHDCIWGKTMVDEYAMGLVFPLT